MKTKALSVVGLLVGLIILVAWFLFLYKPASDELSQVNSEIEEAKTEQMALQGELAGLQQLKEQEGEIDDQLVALQQAAPEVADEQGLIAAIQKVATDNNVELPSVTVSQPTPGAELSTMNFQLETNGTYKNVTLFLAALMDPTKMPRVVTFDQMQISPSSSSSDEATGGSSSSGTAASSGGGTQTVAVSLSGRAFTTQAAGVAPAGDQTAQATEAPESSGGE